MSAASSSSVGAAAPAAPSAAEQEAASKEVREVGLELIAIKNAMKRVMAPTNGDSAGSTENTLKVTAMKVCLLLQTCI